jgi:hypothetical protein
VGQLPCASDVLAWWGLAPAVVQQSAAGNAEPSMLSADESLARRSRIPDPLVSSGASPSRRSFVAGPLADLPSAFFCTAYLSGMLANHSR